MWEAYKEQVKNLIDNFASSREHVPFVWELEEHPAFWPIFKSLNDNEKIAINEIIKEYITESITKLKTKWWLLFKRFFDNNAELFWQFRSLNEDEQTSDTQEFQTLWKQIENEMFKLEGILTQAMLKREQWLEKTVDAFYSIVYRYFPLFSHIE